MPDPDLIAALKQAKSKKMFFAFISKGAGGKLTIAKAKIPAKVLADAKKEVGSNVVVTGKCFGEAGAMVFQVAKAPPKGLAAALKKVVREDAGITINPDVRMANDADSEEAEGEEGGEAAPKKANAPAAAPATDTAAAPTDDAAEGAAPGAPATGAKPAGQANVLGLQKGLLKLGYDPGKADGVMGPKTKAAITKFQQASGLAADGILGPKTQAALAKALQGGAAPAGGAAAANGATAAGGAQTPPGRVPANPGGSNAPSAPSRGAAPNLGPWTAARQEAIKDLKALATKVAGTKHRSAAGVLKEIQTIIAKLPATPAANDIDKLEQFVRNDETITAAEEVPAHFHKLDIRKPLLEALEGLRA